MTDDRTQDEIEIDEILARQMAELDADSRPIQGIAREYSVSTNGISDGICKKLIEQLEHKGHLPFRSVSQKEGSVMLDLATGFWDADYGGEEYVVLAIGHELAINRAEDVRFRP